MRTRSLSIPITTDRACEQCGYNLIGQSVGGLCPECGTPIPSVTTASAPAFHAPASYLRVMSLAMWGMAIAPLAYFILRVIHDATKPWGVFAEFACVGLWCAGAVMASLPAAHLPSSWSRTVARWLTIITQLAWITLPVLTWFSDTQWAVMPEWATIVGGVAVLIGLLGLLALQAPLADLAFALRDEDLGAQLRSSIIAVLTAFITLVVIGVLVRTAPILVLLFWVIRYIAIAGFLVSGAIVLWSLASLGKACSWALVEKKREAHDRERWLRPATAPTVRSCACGFDLSRAPRDATCPACGRSPGADAELPRPVHVPETGDVPLAARPDRAEKPRDPRPPAPGAAESSKIVRSRTSISARRRRGEKPGKGQRRDPMI